MKRDYLRGSFYIEYQRKADVVQTGLQLAPFIHPIELVLSFFSAGFSTVQTRKTSEASALLFPSLHHAFISRSPRPPLPSTIGQCVTFCIIDLNIIIILDRFPPDCRGTTEGCFIKSILAQIFHRLTLSNLFFSEKKKIPFRCVQFAAQHVCESSHSSSSS